MPLPSPPPRVAAMALRTPLAARTPRTAVAARAPQVPPTPSTPRTEGDH